jgi:hypothetical protein
MNGRRFEYHRVGYDHRPMVFRGDGTFASGGLSTSYPDALVSWTWNFGGIGTSSQQNPNFTFVDNGTYTVTLTVTDDDGSIDTAQQTVTVLNASPIILTVSDLDGYEGELLEFTATFHDPGVLDTHTGVIDWGDGTSGQAEVVATPGRLATQTRLSPVNATRANGGGAGIGPSRRTRTPPRVQPLAASLLGLWRHHPGLQEVVVYWVVSLGLPPFRPGLLVLLEILARLPRQSCACPLPSVLVAVINQADKQWYRLI